MSFLGMRGTGDWATNQRPESWRETILYLYPNGRMPLTAMMSKMKSLEINDPTRHWWTKTLQTQSGAVTGVYTDASLATAYTSGGVANDRLYIKMAAATVAHFRVGHQVLLRDASNPDVDVNAEVEERVSNGASSYVKVRLLEADDNSATNDLSDCDTILVIGNINAQGATTPDSLKYDPTEYSNKTQIFRTPVSMTNTARVTHLRTGDAWKEDSREALEYHGIEMEKAFIWGQTNTGTGDNGKPKTTLQGVIPFLKANQAGNVFNYQTNTNYSGQTWLQGGQTWLNATLEQLFRYGETEYLMIAGSGAVLGIQQLAEANGWVKLEPKTVDYGIQVHTWHTYFGPVHIKTHPLFSYEETNRNTALLLHPKNLVYCYLPGRDTQLIKDVQIPGTDGKTDEYLTECTLEIHHPVTFGLLHGVGLASTV